MDTSLICPKCEKEIEPIWKFGGERCPECKTMVGKFKMYKMTDYVPLGNAEISRRNVIGMVKEGILSEKDIR